MARTGLRLTALWLSVARLHLKRGRLEKKKKAELNIADRGCDIFYENNIKQIPLSENTAVNGDFQLRFVVLKVLWCYLTSSTAACLPLSGTDGSGECLAHSLLISRLLTALTRIFLTWGVNVVFQLLFAWFSAAVFMVRNRDPARIGAPKQPSCQTAAMADNSPG